MAVRCARVRRWGFAPRVAFLSLGKAKVISNSVGFDAMLPQIGRDLDGIVEIDRRRMVRIEWIALRSK
jgi:hypothetical protein